MVTVIKKRKPTLKSIILVAKKKKTCKHKWEKYTGVFSGFLIRNYCWCAKCRTYKNCRKCAKHKKCNHI